MLQYVLICSNVNSLAALLHMTSPPDLRSRVQNSWVQYRLKMRKLRSFLPVLVQHFHPARRTATSGTKSRLERLAPWLPEAADRASWTHETQTDKDRTFRPFRTNDSQFPLSTVGSSMFQVAAKGQPPEGTQAKPAGSRHGGSWNAGFDPAAKEPKSMQGRNAKTTKTTTKVQKAAKGCKRHKIAIWKKSRPRTVLTCRRWSWVHALAHSSQPSMEFTTYDCHAMGGLLFQPPTPCNMSGARWRNADCRQSASWHGPSISAQIPKTNKIEVAEACSDRAIRHFWIHFIKMINRFVHCSLFF